MSEENIEMDVWIKEAQVFIHNSLQTMVTQVLDNVKESDPFTVVTLINQISEVYLENLKSEWLKLALDRQNYEKEIKKDLEVLAEEVG